MLILEGRSCDLQWKSLHEMCHQAPARRTPTLLLIGGSDDEVAGTNRCWQERLPRGG
jgi:hypothetical protein